MSVTITFHATEVISYAMAHNRISVVHNVEIRSVDEHHGAELVIEVRDDEGLVSRPFSRTVDLAAGQVTSLELPDLQLDPAVLLQNRESRPAWVTASVAQAGETLTQATQEVRVLAGNSWLARPPGIAMELLAAYVMPNDPAVPALLVQAAPYLELETGRSALDGYQSGEPERVDAIVKSIWRAVQDRTIRYAEPPASWADDGQKIRTPTEVLEGGLGTCLDTTVTLAALLECAGVRPLLWVIRGHAFLGYWRHEAALDAVAYPEADELMNLIDLGIIRLVETTMMTDDFDSTAFEETHRPALNHIADLRVVQAVVDVWQARQARIVPLPSRRVLSDGSTQIIEYQAGGADDRKLVIEYTGERPASVVADDAPPRIQQWKNSLLDLSLRNRLINYTDRAGVRLRVPDGQLGQIEDLISARKPLTLRPADQVEQIDRERGMTDAGSLPNDRVRDVLIDKQCLYTNVTEAAYQTRMRGIAYKARTLQEETGANNLYLALGSLAWSLDGKQLRSPLILVPVRLTTTARGAVYRLTIDESGGSTPNFCLLEKLRITFGLQIPGLANPEEDLSGIDLAAALDATRQAIAAKGLPFHVQETADMSILQFAKFRLWKDLDDHWQTLMSNPLVRHLVETPTAPFDDPVEPLGALDLDALDAASPVPADASQLEAVAEAVAGRTFVLEGPPGTGKSQTITNLLTHAVASGKKVLFVAEKRAALDVVSTRLASVGMATFSLDLHDKASKPTVVRAQIKQALDHHVAIDEQGLASNDEDLRASRRVLARYAERLHEANAAGYSFYSARTALLALGEDGVALPVPQPLLADRDRLSKLRDLLRALPDVADVARPNPDHPWGFVTLTTLDPAAIEPVRAASRAIDESLARLESVAELREVLASATNVEDLTTLEQLSRQRMPLELLDTARTDAWKEASASYTQQLAGFIAASHPGLDIVTPGALDLPIADIHAEAQAAESSGFFGKGKRRKAVLARLEPVIRPGVSMKPRQVVDVTTALMQVQGAVRGLANQATSVPGVTVPAQWNPFTEAGQQLVERQVEWLGWASAAVESESTNPFTASLRRWLRDTPQVAPEVCVSLASLAGAFRTIGQQTASSPADIARWAGERGLVGRWQSSGSRRQLDDPGLLSLRRWVTFNAALQPLRDAGMKQATTTLIDGIVDADDAVRAFDRGVAIASLHERRIACGLDSFDALSHDKAVGRFTTSLGAARSLMASVVPSRVLSARPFQTTSGRGRIGELQRELNKQRGGLGVRALMQTFGDLVTQLMPCILVSPDSVARFFPVGSQTFDLVVFDEASQIRVADAIGAMGRAGSVVVVGDSKQMPPTSFAEAATSTEEEDGAQVMALEDEESILTEAVMARVSQRWLTWHYRSQDESLIAFSNLNYYDSKLSSFPAPTASSADRLASGHGISLVRVNGEFLREAKGKLLRTNPVEADAIFAEIKRRFAAEPDSTPSVGVVTFNQQQRTYIEGLIRDSQDERIVEALDGTNGEGLFVKNLENVQGDERDVILFSTAFSVNAKGVLPLNFGPLTRAGGERRLNVAITRARQQVIIFSSFNPEQIRVEQTQSVGIAHLRGYMELAAHGAGALQASGRVSAVPDRHRDEIAGRLREAGLIVHTDIGLSDFRVDISLATAAEPDRPLVAVLLDGPGWASRRTVGDRDGLPVDVLAKLMHWPAVERVWMPTWLSHSEEVIAHLVAVTKGAQQVPPAVPSAAGSGSHSPQIPVALAPEPQIASASPPPVAEPASATAAPVRLIGESEFHGFVPSRRSGRWVLDGLPGRSEADQVRSVIAQVIEVEGPVHIDRLARLVAACFELTRLNQDRIDSIARLVPAATRKVTGEPFAWPDSIDPDTWSSFRAEQNPERLLEHVSLHELGNAMVALCRESAGMTATELTSETLAVFGWKRRTNAALTRLEDGLALAVRRQVLVTAGERFEAS